MYDVSSAGATIQPIRIFRGSARVALLQRSNEMQNPAKMPELIFMIFSSH
jgi:hypothetical protein